MCTDNKNLSAKQWICGPGDVRAYDGSQFCILHPQGAKTGGIARKIIVGAGVGVVSAFCIALLMYLVRKNPSKAKQVMVGTHACALPASRRMCTCVGVILVRGGADFNASALRGN